VISVQMYIGMYMYMYVDVGSYPRIASDLVNVARSGGWVEMVNCQCLLHFYLLYVTYTLSLPLPSRAGQMWPFLFYARSIESV
jgi:hypothetical protein